MSEIQEKDYQVLKKSWNYSVKTDCNCDPALASEIALFSRYPIESTDVISSGKAKGGAIRSEILVGEKTLVVYVAHPAAPVSGEWFDQRNETLFDLIIPRLKLDSGKAVIFMGDLNTSPYSNTYKKLDRAIPEYTNSLHGSNTFKTWCLGELPIACAPIDHLFTTPSVSTTKPNISSITGSDHDLLSTEFVIR